VSDIRFFDELEAELQRAARRRLARHRGPWGARLRPWSLSRGLSALIVAAGAAAAVGVAVIALVALHHGRPSSSPPATGHHFKLGPRPPQPGPIPPNVDDGVIANAYNTAAKRDPACGPRRGPVGGAKLSTGTPSAAMLSTLPVLNHPATRLDRLPASLYFGGGRLEVGSGAGKVYGRYIRRARVADGISFYLVPATGLGQPPLSPPAAERCYRLLVAALASELPRVPRAERATTRRYGDAGFAYDRYSLETTSDHEGVFLLEELHTGGGGGSGGQTPATIRQTGILGEIGGGTHSTPVMDGIVPARVASVTLQFPATRHGNHHLPPLGATGDVVNDVFAIRIPTLFERGGWPSNAIWRSASGQIIKTVNERPFHP
jgi:hypothetical protein